MNTTAVIGLGNPLMGDDGFGLEVLARLRDEWILDGVELADGGTWGMSLLPIIEDAERLLLLDAIAAGAEPGDVVVLE
ncbi:MAG: hydrogenase maturation protease, partial [Gemmatimonadaceae bacterium]